MILRPKFGAVYSRCGMRNLSPCLGERLLRLRVGGRSDKEKTREPGPAFSFGGARRFGRYDTIPLRRSEKPGRNSNGSDKALLDSERVCESRWFGSNRPKCKSQRSFYLLVLVLKRSCYSLSAGPLTFVSCRVTAANLPSGFPRSSSAAICLAHPQRWAFAPDGRLFVCQRVASCA